MKKGLMVLSSLLLVLGVGFTSSCSSLPTTGSEDDNKTSSVVSSGEVTISGVNTCEVGATAKLSATVKNDPTREGVSWSSSNVSVATVNDDGLVTGVGEGSTTITATMIGDTNVSSSITFTVTASSEPSVKIVAEVTSATVGTSITLRADVYNPKNRELTYEWKTNNGLATLSGAKTDTCKASSSKTGDEKVSLRVGIGQVVLETSISIYFSENYSSYTEISTVDEFKTAFLKSGAITGKYCLTADIDLSGVQVNGGSLQNDLQGILDGRGHSVKGYEVIGNESESFYPNTGLFFSVSGTIRNTHFSGVTKQQGVGWGSSVLTNLLTGTISNCLVEYENAFNQGSDSWFPFVGALCGVLKEGAKVSNNVVNVTGEGQGAAMAICAYAAGKDPSTVTYKVDGIYTNQTPSATYGSDWDWGVSITTATNCETEIVWGETKASLYTTLSEKVWNLVDNQMPTLNVL